jgi:hypothetical protein
MMTRHLVHFGCVLAIIVLISIIMNITLSSSLEKNIALTYYRQNQASAQHYEPFKYQFIKNSYADSNTRQIVSNVSSNQNGTTNDDATTIKQPDTTITLLSLLFSFGIVSTILFVVNYFIKGSKMEFWDIVRDGSGFPSLARFQFLLWTFILMFAVLGVFLIRLFMGTPKLPDDIPENLLILTGISIAVPFVSNPLSSMKYGDRKPITGTLAVDPLNAKNRRPLKTMLMENDKPTVSRFQMFAWTWISIIIYLGYFFSQITLLTDVNILVVPDIPQVFVYLMGLSQVAYVGNKATLSKSIAVTQVVPKQAAARQPVTIRGTNFGPKEQGRVLFEDGNKEELGNQVIVPTSRIKRWEESVIIIEVPDQAEGLNAGDYYIRVDSRGLLTHKAGGLDEEAQITVT